MSTHVRLVLFSLLSVWQDSLYEHNQKQRVLRLWGKRVTQVRFLCTVEL